MSLLGRHSLIIHLIILIGASLSISCNEDEPLNLNSPRQDTAGVSFKTFSLKGKNIYIDSVKNALNPVSILFGTFPENNYPSTEAVSFIEFVPSSDSVFGNNRVFDSLSIGFFSKDSAFGNSGKKLKISVFRLQQSFNNLDKIYRSTALNYKENDSVGTFSFIPNNIRDSLTFTLSKKLGKNILNYFDKGSIGSAENFINYFKGLAVKPVSGNSIVRFDAKDFNHVKMNLHYHHDKGKEVITFVINRRYNQIKSKDFQSLNSYDKIPENLTPDSTGIIQPSIGSLYKLDFKEVENFIDTNSAIDIKQAKIELQPFVENNVYANSPEYINLFAYLTNKNGKLNFSGNNDPWMLANENAPFFKTLGGRDLQIVNYANNKYVLNITKHLLGYLDGKIPNNDIILSTQPSIANPGKITFNVDKTPVLKLYYTR